MPNAEIADFRARLSLRTTTLGDSEAEIESRPWIELIETMNELVQHRHDVPIAVRSKGS